MEKGTAMTSLPNPRAAAPTLPEPAACAPWWRFPIVWLTLAGPAIVVVACLVTIAIAFRHADVVVSEAPARQVARGADLAGAKVPALQARNHAATPSP